MADKILQIIPAVQEAWAVYKPEDGEKPVYSRIHFWALIEKENGERVVDGFDIGEYTGSVENSDAFAGYIDFRPQQGMSAAALIKTMGWNIPAEWGGYGK